MSRDERAMDSALNYLGQELNAYSTENQYVTFTIGEEEYGIDIMLVQEIIRYSKPTRVFNTNPIIKGVINFRGKIIPVIDMHLKFNLPGQQYDEFTVVIVIEVQKKTIGMIVDRVSDIIAFNETDIQLVDQEFADDIKTEHIKGMAKSGNRIALLLDPSRVLTFAETELINRELDKENIEVKEQSI